MKLMLPPPRMKMETSSLPSASTKPSAAPKLPSTKPALKLTEYLRQISRIERPSAPHPTLRLSILVFAHVIAFAALGVAQDRVRFYYQFKFLLVASFVWVVLETFASIGFLDFEFGAVFRDACVRS